MKQTKRFNLALLVLLACSVSACSQTAPPQPDTAQPSSVGSPATVDGQAATPAPVESVPVNAQPVDKAEAKEIAKQAFSTLTSSNVVEELLSAVRLNDEAGYEDNYEVPIAKVMQAWPDQSIPANVEVMKPYQSCYDAAAKAQMFGNYAHQRPTVERKNKLLSTAQQVETLLQHCKQAINAASHTAMAKPLHVNGKLCDGISAPTSGGISEAARAYDAALEYRHGHSADCARYDDQQIRQFAHVLPYPFNKLGSSFDTVVDKESAQVTIDPPTSLDNGTTTKALHGRFQAENGHSVEIQALMTDGSDSNDKPITGIVMDFGACPGYGSKADYEQILSSVGLSKSKLKAKGFSVIVGTDSMPAVYTYKLRNPRKDPNEKHEITLDASCQGNYKLDIGY